MANLSFRETISFFAFFAVYSQSFCNFAVAKIRNLNVKGIKGSDKSVKKRFSEIQKNIKDKINLKAICECSYSKNIKR